MNKTLLMEASRERAKELNQKEQLAELKSKLIQYGLVASSKQKEVLTMPKYLPLGILGYVWLNNPVGISIAYMDSLGEWVIDPINAESKPQTELPINNETYERIVSLISSAIQHCEYAPLKPQEILYTGLFEGKTFKLIDLDNEVLSDLPNAYSIFEYDVEEMLTNGYLYEVAENDGIPSGYNFKFEIVERADSIRDTIVKVISIERI